MKCLASFVPSLLVLLAVSTASAADVNLPADFIKECEYYCGDWKSEVDNDGTVYRGTWTVRWSPEKTCLVTHWAAETPDGPAKGTRVEGWDAVAKKVLVVDFGTGGSSSVERYTITVNNVSEGEIAGVHSHGKAFKATARVVRKPDFFTWTVTQDEEAIEYRFSRVKK
jgi:hypothetical protein